MTTMHANLAIWKTGRESLARLFERYTPGQLNHTPPGFSNNMAWNLGHIIAVQQSLVYRLSGLEMRVPGRIWDLYKPGTRPGAPLEGKELEELATLLHTTVETTLADHAAGLFGPYAGLTTSRGFHLETLEDGLAFNNFHEGYHAGAITCLANFLK